MVSGAEGLPLATYLQFALRRIMEGARKKNLIVTLVFINFRKAFDSLHRGILIKILRAYGIPSAIVDLINLLYVNTRGKVITPDGERQCHLTSWLGFFRETH